MLKIKELNENGQAEKLGVLPGDILVSYNGVNVSDKERLLPLIKKNNNFLVKKIPIVINRNNHVQIIFVNKGPIGVVLQLVEDDKSSFVNKTLLDQANDTIRQANLRIASLTKRNLELEQLINVDTFSELTNLEVLGLKETPSLIDLKKNYKTLSTVYHPDKSGNHNIMKKINNAYEQLKLRL